MLSVLCVDLYWLGLAAKQHPMYRHVAECEHGETVLAPTGQQRAVLGPQQIIFILAAEYCLYPIQLLLPRMGREVGTYMRAILYSLLAVCLLGSSGNNNMFTGSHGPNRTGS